MSSSQQHSYHLVDPSPWPLITSLGSLCITFGAVGYFQYFTFGSFSFFCGLLVLIVSASYWWTDVVREGTYEGKHSEAVQNGLRFGMLLFIVSEIMFFASFFWSFFHSSLAPVLEIGGIWPPVGIEVLNPWGVPFLNTVILLSSGCSCTWAHHALVSGNRQNVFLAFVITLLFALAFTAAQWNEYIECRFYISDGVYGSVFFMSTGFHGFHVIIGTLFILVSFIRFLLFQFTANHHVGFEAAAWYWHFVDVVWLFLFASIYWWGNEPCSAPFIYFSELDFINIKNIL